MTEQSSADRWHSDPDILAMMAMGEPDIPLADELHVQECPECLDELNSLVRVATLARSGSPLEHPLDAPGPAVWGAISRTLGLATDVRPAMLAAEADVPTRRTPDPAVRVASVPPPRGHRAPRPSSRRSRRFIVPILAGALAAVVATGAILVASNTLAPRTVVPKPKILAEAPLTALPDWTGSSGEAVIERTGSQRQVVVSVSESRDAPGYREVWLISSDLKKLISVGVLAGTKGTFTIPTDVNLAEYPIVDVSSEQPDGNPAHSGNSIVRGTL